jgi:hypothetical protein
MQRVIMLVAADLHSLHIAWYVILGLLFFHC